MVFLLVWENGPDGVRTDRDIVNKCYSSRRKDIIREKHSLLNENQVDFIAHNTSGLWGHYFEEVIERYVRSGELIRRPYRKGICPTNPSTSGVVIEKAFYPQQLEFLLQEYGFKSQFINPYKPVLKGYSPICLLKYAYKLMRQSVRSFLNKEWYLSANHNFQLLAIKDLL